MSWTYLRDERPVARKSYRCWLCERAIDVGEKHRARSGVTEDGPVTIRMHEACVSRTADWDEDEWDYHDAAKFRRLIDGGPEVEDDEPVASDGEEVAG